MSRGFYNYDTRGASVASQIITLERMLSEQEELNDRLRQALENIARALADNNVSLAAEISRSIEK